MRIARLFLGLPYLWGGTSAFGFDCSGFTYLDLKLHGVTIPRDAEAQARAGTAVAVGALRPGDLLFYARAGTIHHVAMHAGNEQMAQSPETGRTLEVVSLDTRGPPNEYVGARRYLG